ncbi:MAG: LysE family translocator, partial [Microvirga sp.]
MELAGLILFSSALFVAAASPGPGIAAIVARVLGRGSKEAIPFSIGIALGDVVWLTFAVLGLATLAQAFHEIFLVVKYAGAAYLLYLAYKIWTAPVVARDVEAQAGTEHPAKLLFGGLALTLGNPKTIVFY